MQRDFINNLLADVAEEDRWLLIAKEVERFSIAVSNDRTEREHDQRKVVSGSSNAIIGGRQRAPPAIRQQLL
jgi:hypothetical protein